MSIQTFEELLVKHGDSPRALDWSEEGQRRRFEVLMEIGIANDSRVLDVGCGLGHFYDAIRARGYFGEYTGIDLSAGMIAAATARFGGKAHFIHQDATVSPLPNSDFVVSSGMLNTRPCTGHMESLLARCFNAANTACAVNMLSELAPTKRSDRFYYSPVVMLEHALKLTKRVTLRHDYRDNDFTLYLYK